MNTKTSVVTDEGVTNLTPSTVRQILSHFEGKKHTAAKNQWLRFVAARIEQARPDIFPAVSAYLGVKSTSNNPLHGLGITAIGVVYEALLASLDQENRRTQGQYFTPADICRFMSTEAASLPPGTWVDPCCGVGNLSWYLVNEQDNQDTFIAEKLTLIDTDEVALKTAVALLAADFSRPDGSDTLEKLSRRSRCCNYLSTKVKADFAILNPPYGRTDTNIGLRTDTCHELYAQFLEKVTTQHRGFVAITPSSFIHAAKFSAVRAVLLDARRSFDIYSFDNVPDTVFRGFKYGATNTSVTNFVRAAITVMRPQAGDIRLTPILRWKMRSRETMLARAKQLLRPFRVAADGYWLRLMPGTEKLWEELETCTLHLGDLLSTRATGICLEVAASPRYFISAAKRSLSRSSKKLLYFASETDRDLAYVVLNSSLAYWWWRSTDGGFTINARTLRTLPIPHTLTTQACRELTDAIYSSEAKSLVTKLNSARVNENVKHSPELMKKLDTALFGEQATRAFAPVYAPDLFDDQIWAQLRINL